MSLLAASLLSISTGSAIAAGEEAAKASGTSDLAVRIVKGQVRLAGDGSVSVSVRARCTAPLDAFEVDVGVNQVAGFGAVVLLGTDFPPCDGHWHGITVLVSPEAGSFVEGDATVGAFLGAFDPTVGSDVEATDTVTVRL